MAADIRPDELVSCKVCEAILTRSGRPLHMIWHARINARLFTLEQQLTELRFQQER